MSRMQEREARRAVAWIGEELARGRPRDAVARDLEAGGLPLDVAREAVERVALRMSAAAPSARSSGAGARPGEGPDPEGWDRGGIPGR